MKKLSLLLIAVCAISVAHATENNHFNILGYQYLTYKDIAADKDTAWVGYQYWDPMKGDRH